MYERYRNFDDARHNTYIISEEGKTAISTFAEYKYVELTLLCYNKRVNTSLMTIGVFKKFCHYVLLSMRYNRVA